MDPVRKSPDASAFALMVLLCAVWGFGNVAAKLAAPGVSLVAQAGIRSVIATLLLLGWARWRGIPLFGRDGTLWPGLLAGLLFAAEFLFIFIGLQWTGAGRMAVFVYLAPFFTALGLAWYVPGERLGPRQWAGIAVAFSGVALAFGDAFVNSRSTLLGDAFGVFAALMWAATTVLIRGTRLSGASAAKTLFYQLGVAAVTLPLCSLLLGEPGLVKLDAITVASLFYQSVIVAFASYLAWFWLLTRYFAARLSVFSFLTPLFGVAVGALVLDEPLTLAFLGAALLVGAGIYLVNSK
ncbi:MAG: DMT family transporter [Betaproteobacteria bacterium]|nr:DMT family transporter [Betaproteobacteria bacterium]